MCWILSTQRSQMLAQKTVFENANSISLSPPSIIAQNSINPQLNSWIFSTFQPSSGVENFDRTGSVACMGEAQKWFRGKTDFSLRSAIENRDPCTYNIGMEMSFDKRMMEKHEFRINSPFNNRWAYCSISLRSLESLFFVLVFRATVGSFWS